LKDVCFKNAGRIMCKNIITGATGFIGYALCQELLENDEYVIAVVRQGSKNKKKLEKLKGLEIVELELSELELLHKEYQIKADCFYHMAWNGSSGKEMEDFRIQRSNIAYMGKAIEAAKSCGCSKIVGAGSQAEYGVCREETREDVTPLSPFMMYGAAKAAAYQLGKILARQVDISFVWPRIYSIYGVGENPGTLVNYVMECLLKEEVPEITSCENMWNYMYITDCVKALRILGESIGTDGIYNIASKDTRPLKEFVKEIRDTIAPEREIKFGWKKMNPEQIFWLKPNVEKLYALNNFMPRISFKEGIQRKLSGEYNSYCKRSEQ